MILEFTTTECVRPEIAAMGYQSFVENLQGVDFKRSTLYTNIDPIPTPNVGVMEVVARKFFGNVVVRKTKRPNFCNAVKWCWSQPKGRYFFHLESDWVLKCPIKIDVLIRILNRPTVCAVNLRAYPQKTGILCLSPALIETKTARGIAVKLNPRHNPERQLRPKAQGGAGLQPKGLRSVHFPKRIVIVDIGRAWLKKRKLVRNAGFTSWVYKAKTPTPRRPS